jgi:hypothetical protein
VALSASGRNILAESSDVSIKASTRRLMGYASKQRWLTLANRYRTNTVQALDADHAAGTISARNLTDYVAASAPLHCCDGWALLGRALACHLRGDADVTRHLAYYAELRAAMSLLATQGVGVFNKRHFVIDQAGGVQKVASGGTHAVAWDLLEAWAGLPSAANMLGEVLIPGGQPVGQWVAELPQGATWQPIATQWLKEIGLDLELFGTQDHDARNEASYRPNHLGQRPVLASTDAARATRELWMLLEPSPPLSFGELDRYLLRRTLESAFFSVTGRSHKRAHADFRTQVDAAAAACVGAGQTQIWSRFLRRIDDPQDPEILTLAQCTPRLDRPDYHVSMMARALLLLRVASGATRRMLIDAGVGLESLGFWWKPYGEGLGLWDHPAPNVAQLTDGWADTKAALDDIDISLAAGALSSYRGIVSELPRPFANLTSLEMVGVWSLAA